MDLIPIFEENYSRKECKLWAVKYPYESENEFDRLFNLWTNPTYLRTFFTNNQEDLCADFWRPITTVQAIKKVREEALLFENTLIEIENLAKENSFEFLHDTFRTLNDREESCRLPIDLKGKASHRMPMLRLYGLMLEDNTILITGGGIKLTRSISESPHLVSELAKLKIVKEFLKRNDIIFIENYDE